jgi:hypothetical protein
VVGFSPFIVIRSYVLSPCPLFVYLLALSNSHMFRIPYIEKNYSAGEGKGECHHRSGAFIPLVFCPQPMCIWSQGRGLRPLWSLCKPINCEGENTTNYFKASRWCILDSWHWKWYKKFQVILMAFYWGYIGPHLVWGFSFIIASFIHTPKDFFSTTTIPSLT